MLHSLRFLPALRKPRIPAKIVSDYVKAAGGSKALSKIQTMTLEGTFTNPADGKSGTYTFDTKLPNRYYSELVLGDKNVIEAYNGKSAWHQSHHRRTLPRSSARKDFNSKPLPAITTHGS